jgi:hypothetical protein
VAGRDQARHQPVDFIRVCLLRNNLLQARCRRLAFSEVAGPANEVGSAVKRHEWHLTEISMRRADVRFRGKSGHTRACTDICF